ncbi:MAG TPA: hypothetical protein VEY12_03815 [Thermoplasmata archaeon]|nr:hypothetical protein [Thermoplasmata archaeon]
MRSDSSPDRQRYEVRPLKQRREENRAFDSEASWREWLRQRYAKYWYGMGSLLLDGMVVGTILQYTDTAQAWPYVLSAIVAVGLVYLEFLGLRHFWPPKRAS